MLDKESDDGTIEGLTDWLKRQAMDQIDQPVRLGTQKHLDCRLVAVRLPRKLAQQRLRELKKTLKKKGRTPSDRQRVPCQWLVLITDLAANRFTIDDIFSLYRVRWQIELLFKRWKSLAGLGRSRGHRAYRVLCETYAKLLGCLVQHWGTLLRGGPLSRTSTYQRAKQMRRFATKLATALEDLTALMQVVERLAARLRRLPAQAKSRRRPSTRQLLFGARLTF
jgi:Transposase DDE domain